MIFAQSGELSSILQRGLEDIETLSQVDRFRFHLGFSTTLRHYETAFLAWKSGLLARQSWTGMEASLRQLLAFGGGAGTGMPSKTSSAMSFAHM